MKIKKKFLDKSKQLARKFFHERGKPVQLSDGQAEIFAAIYFRLSPRVQAICPTQYGKSFTVALAVLLAAIATREKWLLVAPTGRKSTIIMNHIITHAFDHPAIEMQLEAAAETKQRLKESRSKQKITLRHGGSIEILSLQSLGTKSKVEAAMGEGAPNVVGDEISLIDDETESVVSRMVGGHETSGKTFLMKIGNPFYRNHFMKSWQGSKYKKIFIDYKQAIREKRFTKSFIEEMRPKPFFSIYYQCKFPNADELDAKGFRALLTADELEAAFTKKNFPLDGGRCGGDIGAGGDASVYSIRLDKFLKVVARNKTKDTMVQISAIRDVKEKFKLDDRKIAIDDTGIGRGVSDRCAELDDLEKVNGVGFGDGAPDGESDKFKNLKAYLFWQFMLWIKAGGKLPESQRDDFLLLLEMRYKKTSDDRILFEEKKYLKKRIGKSPDEIDSGALTFVPPARELTVEMI